MICLISFSKFSDFLLAFTCAIAVGNLLRDILSPLPFRCSLKPRIFSIISNIIFGFSFLGIYFLRTVFLKSMNSSLILLTNCSFLGCLALIKSFAKNK